MQRSAKLSLALSALTAAGFYAHGTLTGPVADSDDATTLLPRLAVRVDATPPEASPATERLQKSGNRIESDGFYRAPRGGRFVFDVRSVSKTQLRPKTGAGQTIAQTVTGKLELCVVERDPAELVVSARFFDSEPVHLVGGRATETKFADAWRAELEQRFAFRMHADGRLAGIRFADRTRPAVRTFLRTLLCGQLFVIPSDAGSRWQVREAGVDGEVAMGYQRNRDGRISRRKLRNRSRESEQSQVATATKGGSIGRPNAELGWIDEIAIRETYSAEIELADAAIVTAGEFSADIRLVSHDRMPASEWSVLAASIDIDAAWAPVHGDATELDIAAERSARSAWRSRLGDAQIDKLVRDLVFLLSSEPIDHMAALQARRAIIWKLRLDPEGLETIEQMLRNRTLPERALQMIAGALGSVQNAQAQNLLASFTNDQKLPKDLRLDSITSMIQIAEPSNGVLAALREQSGSLSGDSDVRGSAQLILGAFASREGADPALVTELLALEKTARRPVELATWLDALANTESPEVAKAARRYLKHENKTVREAAALALAAAKTDKSKSSRKQSD